jgi:hypothetical protein
MKNSQKGFVVPLLVAIIAVLVIAGDIYIYENNKKSEAPVVDTGLQQLVQQQTNTQTIPVTTRSNVSNNPPVVAKIAVIKLTSPSGGETYTNAIPVRWNSENIQGNVSIQVLFASKVLFTLLSVPNTGSKDIDLSDHYSQSSSGNVAYIKICDSNGVCDTNKNPFAFTYTPTATNIKTVLGVVQQKDSYYHPVTKGCENEFVYRISNANDGVTGIFAISSAQYLNNQVMAQIGPVTSASSCSGNFEVYKLQTLDEFYPAKISMPAGSSKDITSHVGDFTIILPGQKTVKIVTSKLNNIYSDINPQDKVQGWSELYNRATNSTPNQGGMPSATYLEGRYLNDSTFQVEDIYFTVG